MKLNFKLITACLLCFMTIKASAQNAEIKGNTFDGPYLLYKADSILIKEVDFAAQKPVLNQLSYLQDNKKNVTVSVRFSDAPEKDFKVKLRSKIEIEPSVWKQPEKILVLSDIEGEFDALRDLLLANKVINKKYEWIFGQGHLVVCGDLFDRGKDVPATLWLLYKLEDAARQKGGYVHTILGNHDIMNLAGNFKYVDKKYFISAETMGNKYIELYDGHTEMGNWLRSKNLLEKIGENLCMHGGVSPEVNDLALSTEQINEISRPYIGHQDLKNTVKDDRILKIFNSTVGLFWYRGYFKDSPDNEKIIDQTLKQFGVKRIIVGHTITETNIGFYHHAKVLGVDVNQHEGKREAALYTNSKWYKVNLTGDKILLN